MKRKEKNIVYSYKRIETPLLFLFISIHSVTNFNDMI